MREETFFKIWFALVAVLACGWIVFLIWAISKVVIWLTM